MCHFVLKDLKMRLDQKKDTHHLQIQTSERPLENVPVRNDMNTFSKTPEWRQFKFKQLIRRVVEERKLEKLQ